MLNSLGIEDYFLKSHSEFEAKLEFVSQIFKFVGRQNDQPRRIWANTLFFRLLMVGNSVLILCNEERRHKSLGGQSDMSVLDHSSIATLARNLLEASVMFAYVSDHAISENEWLLRREVLELHKATTDYLVSKNLGDIDAAECKEKMTSLKNAIASDGLFKSLKPTELQEQILRGQQQYIHGLRGAVKEAGWDVDEFNGIWAMLSSFAHSSPISFPVGNSKDPLVGVAPELQYQLVGLALQYVTGWLGLACERMFCIFPETFLKFETKH
jgi:hypothetical protein